MAALNELVVTTDRLRAIPVHLIARGEIAIRDPHVALHLYRIVQEALNNAVKHARASEIECEIEARDGVLRLRIADNGVGMAETSGSSRGMGLQTMGYRARAIGAELVLEKNAGGGTVVRCRLSLVEPGDPAPGSMGIAGAGEARADATTEDRDKTVPAYTI